MYSIEPKIIIATGGFDPLHNGHIKYLTEAKKLGDKLIVAVNSNSWLVRKKGTYLMNWEERSSIVAALGCVDEVLEIDDSDNSSRDAIKQVRIKYPHSIIVFANGGDRTSDNIPELDEQGVEFEFGVGGTDKLNSSSSILRRYAEYIRNVLELEAGPNRRY